MPNAPTYRITSTAQAEALIADIRRAVRQSARTGGGYGVFRRDGDGPLAVSIEVAINYEQCQPAKRGGG